MFDTTPETALPTAPAEVADVAIEHWDVILRALYLDALREQYGTLPN